MEIHLSDLEACCNSTHEKRTSAHHDFMDSELNTVIQLKSEIRELTGFVDSDLMS